MRKIVSTILFLFLVHSAFTQVNISDILFEIDQSEYGMEKAELYKQAADFYYISNNDSALFFYDKALSLYIEFDNKKEQMKCLSKLSVIHNNFGKTDTAFALVYQAIKIGETNTYTMLLSESYLRLGNFYHEKRKYNKAKTYYYKCIKNGLPNIKNSAWGALGNVYNVTGSLDSAFFYLNQSLEYFLNKDTTSDDIIYNLSSLYGSMGVVLSKMNKVHEGYSYFKESLRLSEKIGNDNNTINCLINLSISCDLLDKPKYSEYLLIKALALADSLSYDKHKMRVYKVLSEHFVEYGDFQTAFTYLNLYHNIQDSLSSLEFEKKIYENELLLRDVELEKVKAEKIKNIVVFLFLFTIVGFLLIMTIIHLSKKLKLRTLEKDSFESKSEILNTQLINAKNKLASLNAHIVEQNKFIIEHQKVLGDNKVSESESVIEDLKNRKIIRNDDWEQYIEVFEQLYPNFLSTINTRIPDLSEGDKRQLIMLKLNYSRKKSSEILGVSPNSVKRAQQRLSKKLLLNDVTELEGFISGIICHLNKK